METTSPKPPLPDGNKPRSKRLHWLARISTTIGLAALSYFYLKWSGLLGGILLLGLLVALSSLEFSRISQPEMPRYRRLLIMLVSFFMPYFFHRQLASDSIPFYVMVVIEVFLLITILITLSGILYTRAVETVSRSLIFPVWGIALPLSSLVFIAHLVIDKGASSNSGLLWALCLILIIKSTDIGALIIGSLLGRRKLAPLTSPGKTIEGAIGGVIVSVIIALVLVASIDFDWPSSHNLPPYALWIKVILCAGVIAISGFWGIFLSPRGNALMRPKTRAPACLGSEAFTT
jgi:CDP-diglyceride synthetase